MPEWADRVVGRVNRALLVRISPFNSFSKLADLLGRHQRNKPEADMFGFSFQTVRTKRSLTAKPAEAWNAGQMCRYTRHPLVPLICMSSAVTPAPHLDFFASGRSGNGQSEITIGSSIFATSRRVCLTKPALTLPANRKVLFS